MSLRILFADDSVTAQNMGKKILTEAGYDVVAVSNGAAAVKKIAEQKPDIIILDVYMPGYTGLEVCEKVRGSMETLKTPVLLTVGKLEPYRAEEGNRVRADGVIIKPFEASDLLAIIKKFEERIGQTPAPPLVRQAVAVERFSSDDEAIEHTEPIVATAPQPTVEVPDHMATASAFSDLLGNDSPNPLNQFDIHKAPPAETLPYSVSERSRIPEYELPVSWRDRVEDEPEAVPEPASVSADPPHAEASAVAEPPPQIHPPQIPVYQDLPEPAVEIIPTASAPIGDVEIPREPALEESAADATRATVADSTEPGLIPTLHREHEPVSPVEREAAELAPVASEYEASIPAASVPALPIPAVSIPEDTQVNAVAEVSTADLHNSELHTSDLRHSSNLESAVQRNDGPVAPPPMAIQIEHSHRDLEGPESDFEARVAAAMAAYSHVPGAPLNPASSVEPLAQMEHSRAVDGALHEAGAEARFEPSAEAEIAAAPQNAPVEMSAFDSHAEDIISEVPETAPPAFEYHPPVGRAVESVVEEPVATEPVAAAPETFAPAHQPSASNPDSLAAHIEAALPAAAAAAGAETGSDHHTIAEAVHRVMERLKPELVEEIVRELKSKK